MLAIKDATINDIHGIVRCCRDFFKYAHFEDEYRLPLDTQSFIEEVAENIESKNGVMLLLVNGNIVVGGISGWVIPWKSFNKNILIALEFFFWVDPEYRGRKSIEMLKLYEKKMLDLGAKRSFMIDVNTELSDKVKKLYSHMGYKPIESLHVKTLGE